MLRPVRHAACCSLFISEVESSLPVMKNVPMRCRGSGVRLFDALI
jgi:hypothetical protein